MRGGIDFNYAKRRRWPPGWPAATNRNREYRVRLSFTFLLTGKNAAGFFRTKIYRRKAFSGGAGIIAAAAAAEFNFGVSGLAEAAD